MKVPADSHSQSRGQVWLGRSWGQKALRHPLGADLWSFCYLSETEHHVFKTVREKKINATFLQEVKTFVLCWRRERGIETSKTFQDFPPAKPLAWVSIHFVFPLSTLVQLSVQKKRGPWLSNSFGSKGAPATVIFSSEQGSRGLGDLWVEGTQYLKNWALLSLPFMH